MKNNNPNLFVLHCQSVYPAPIESLNLAYISRLRELLQLEIGYSSHDLSTYIPALAVAYGAVIIEKHINKINSYSSIPFLTISILVTI